MRATPTLLLLALACDGTKAPSTDSEPVAEIPGDLADLALPEAGEVRERHFTSGVACAECHSNADGAAAMRDETGAELGQWNLWRGTMMANSSRDPFWRAVVSAEVAATPAAAEAIEATCMRCHAPMASADAGLHEETVSMADLTAGTQRGGLALDGVSCTLCHQIEPDGLGEPESFSGGYVIEAEGRIYGPHADPFTNPMEMHVGYTPTESDTVLQSEHCATCHTLYTETLSPEGEAVGVQFSEQSPYLEWQNSRYAGETSCQDCHVPTRSDAGEELETRIARNPHGQDFGQIGPRSPFGQHRFVGGNTLVPAMLRDNAELFGITVEPEAFDATIEAARTQLSERSADLSLVDASYSGGELALEVEIRTYTGHKLPTAYPSRRAWLHLSVRDASGALVLESGGWDDAGRIVGADGQPLASELAGGPVQSHQQRVEDVDAVQIYETVLADSEGQPTFTLLRAASDYKDNRLLPAGWTGDAVPEITPVGTDGDADFAAGGDRLAWRLPLDAQGPLSVEVELVYQPLGARYVDEILSVSTPETRAFSLLWEAADRSPERVAQVETSLP
ncbi:MAG: hypothetical protein H6741_08220 [Alphaproteobacteria bacterium]|nr:hypothetical protein [Alphaproteobacteria bacterium]